MSTVWDVFAAHARRRPAAVAIRGAAEFSYGALAERAEELARELLTATRPGALVALDATEAAAGAIAFLATAKAGCPVLPLSADSPPRHRAAILGRSRAELILREAAGSSFVIEPVDVAADPDPEHAPGPAAARWPSGLAEAAYVMYTSGSTGAPKGVVVSHDALLCRLRGMARRPGFGERDSFLAMTALSFDPCLAELLMPLIVGGQVVAAPPTARLDPEIFAATVRAGRPSVIQATPSFYRLALTAGWTGAPDSTLWCGGEALTPALAGELLPVCAGLWNVYGPTETTIWSCAAQVTSPGSIGLGGPLDGTGLCLTGTGDGGDEDDGGEGGGDGGEGGGGTGLITEPDRPGEILLYGDTLALGYLGRPDLTEERFAVRDTPDGPRRCYATGDRAVFRSDGRLEFLGRTDAQVKLRGHRIELGELEVVLERHPAVREAVVVLRDADRPQTAHLAAFVTTDGGATPRDLRAWLAQRLPLPMRPSRIHVEKDLPRTTTGKVDRVRLAAGTSPASAP